MDRSNRRYESATRLAPVMSTLDGIEHDAVMGQSNISMNRLFAFRLC